VVDQVVVLVLSMDQQVVLALLVKGMLAALQFQTIQVTQLAVAVAEVDQLAVLLLIVLMVVWEQYLP
jgi:hypothetical protein